MRGCLSYVRLDSRVPRDHSLRVIGRITDAASVSLSEQSGALYAEVRRPSIAPERLLRALLLQAFYTIRSELVRRRCGRSKKRGEHNDQHAKRRLRRHRHPKPPAR
jgi:transposase